MENVRESERGKKSREKILESIIDYMLKNDLPPSVREICAMTGISSTSTVWMHLDVLNKQGKIELKEHSPRGIRVPGIHYVDDRDPFK